MYVSPSRSGGRSPVATWLSATIVEDGASFEVCGGFVAVTAGAASSFALVADGTGSSFAPSNDPAVASVSLREGRAASAFVLGLAEACSSCFSHVPLLAGSSEIRSGALSSPLSHSSAVCSGTTVSFNQSHHDRQLTRPHHFRIKILMEIDELSPWYPDP